MYTIWERATRHHHAWNSDAKPPNDGIYSSQLIHYPPKNKLRAPTSNEPNMRHVLLGQGHISRKRPLSMMIRPFHPIPHLWFIMLRLSQQPPTQCYSRRDSGTQAERVVFTSLILPNLSAIRKAREYVRGNERDRPSIIWSAHLCINSWCCSIYQLSASANRLFLSLSQPPSQSSSHLSAFMPSH